MENRDGVNHIEGNLTAAGRSFGIVASRFNDFIVRRLVDGALDAIVRHGGELGSVDVVWVPGSYEIPLAAKRLAVSGRYDAIICLGAVIRGASPLRLRRWRREQRHLLRRAGGESARHLRRHHHRDHRAGDRAGRHEARQQGPEAAATAIEMADLMPRISASSG